MCRCLVTLVVRVGAGERLQVEEVEGYVYMEAAATREAGIGRADRAYRLRLSRSNWAEPDWQSQGGRCMSST